MVTIQIPAGLQHFVETVPLEESVWRFQFDWNSYSETWHLTLSDAFDVVLLAGTPVLPGLFLGMGQSYDPRMPPGMLEVIDMGLGTPTKPTLTSFGTQHQLVYTPRAELAI
jgi:hypothetical protein